MKSLSKNRTKRRPQKSKVDGIPFPSGSTYNTQNKTNPPSNNNEIRETSKIKNLKEESLSKDKTITTIRATLRFPPKTISLAQTIRSQLIKDEIEDDEPLPRCETPEIVRERRKEKRKRDEQMPSLFSPRPKIRKLALKKINKRKHAPPTKETICIENQKIEESHLTTIPPTQGIPLNEPCVSKTDSKKTKQLTENFKNSVSLPSSEAWNSSEEETGEDKEERNIIFFSSSEEKLTKNKKQKTQKTFTSIGIQTSPQIQRRKGYSQCMISVGLQTSPVMNLNPFTPFSSSPSPPIKHFVTIGVQTSPFGPQPFQKTQDELHSVKFLTVQTFPASPILDETLEEKTKQSTKDVGIQTSPIVLPDLIPPSTHTGTNAIAWTQQCPDKIGELNQLIDVLENEKNFYQQRIAILERYIRKFHERYPSYHPLLTVEDAAQLG